MNNQNQIYNYNQIYDTLRTLKVNDYIMDKRDKVHNELYNNALDKLIVEVNLVIDVYKEKCEDKYGIPYYQLGEDAVACFYQIVNDNIEKIKTSSVFVVSIVASILKCLSGTYNKEDVDNLLTFNKEKYQFVEVKHKNWIYPSKLLIIYINNLVCIDKNNKKYSRLSIGPYSLSKFWDIEYVTTNSVENIVTNDIPKYVIEHIDYVKGICKLFDKVNMVHVTVDLNAIQNMNNYEFDFNNFDELFHVKRKINII